MFARPRFPFPLYKFLVSFFRQSLNYILYCRLFSFSGGLCVRGGSRVIYPVIFFDAHDFSVLKHM